jgi:D-lactate dehydrogenase
MNQTSPQDKLTSLMVDGHCRNNLQSEPGEAMSSKLPGAGRYEDLLRNLSTQIPAARLIRDPLRTFAYGTDASFYRLIPKLVVRVQSEAEVVSVIRACGRLNIPYTFRAAGTSLSGQAISDSVLIQLSRSWNGIHLSDDGTIARFEPAVLGSEGNRALARFQRKIGPDPASIDSAMIAGIAANNSSGMCCGNVQDTYHTMASARLVFADGSILDTSSQESWRQFAAERRDLVNQVDSLARRVKADRILSARIRHKFRIKNTTGYSLHALIDFEDPRDIISHLLIGSEGTLGFISEISYNTVPDPPHRATSLVLFPDIHAACDAASQLSKGPAAAVELMDRQSLRSVENKPGIPQYFRELDQEATALLIEVRAESPALLQQQLHNVTQTLESCRLLEPFCFAEDQLQSKRLWEIRKGLFPSLGQARENRTTIIIEDVAFPPEHLAAAAIDLQNLFAQHEYTDAVIFGHALQGNLHFVFCADFNRDEEVRKYAAFMEDVTRLVTEKYDGSLKAEHGSGRNMSPYVEREWGIQAFGVMREIKDIFDPDRLMNPDVILSDNPNIHISDLKKTPVTYPVIEKCTECGFCERTCPSRNLSLTPRQRIAVWREISRLTEDGTDPKRLRRFRRDFNYQGDETCAVDGLCSTLCPLGIDTGKFIRDLRANQRSQLGRLLANAAAENLDTLLSLSRLLLRSASTAHSILGTAMMIRLTRLLRKLSMNTIPAWNPWTPAPASHSQTSDENPNQQKVVYFPSCVSRLFGSSAKSPYPDSQNARIESLLAKAEYIALYPDGLENLCCGMAFSSKGFPRQADEKLKELAEALAHASCGGKYPILMDTSPCAQRLKQFQNRYPSLRTYDIADFLLEFVAPRLKLQKRQSSVAVHVPCSLRKGSQEGSLIRLAKMYANDVYLPYSTPCCGFAGDRGFTTPDLPASALISLKTELPADCNVGYSTSRTCEIGVSLHGGISYQSIAYLVDESTQPFNVGERE